MKRKTVAAMLSLCAVLTGAFAAGASAQEIYYDENGQPYVQDEYGYVYYYDQNGDSFYYNEDGEMIYTDTTLDGASIVSLSANTSDGSSDTSGGDTQQTQDTSSDSWHQTFRTDIQRGGGERETPDANGQIHSYLTGKLTDANVALKRPMAIMINNIINALPQAGLSQAAVIYEAPVEGEITRLMAIFEDVSGMDKIGPVRSCRDYYIDFALEFDAIYTHFGQAVYAYDLLNSDMVNNISGLQYQEAAGEINGYAGEDIFFRTDDRPAPHNCYTSGEQLATAIERKEYSMELDNDYTGHFKFAADGETVTYTDGTATHIVPHLYTNYPTFDYDESTQKYMRSQYPERSAGAAQIDELTGEQIGVDNLIIQYCQIQPYDDNGYLNVNTNSGGEAILFTKGTYQKATWEKATDWGPAKYYDAQGNEIAVNQGSTWVCIVQDTRKGDTSFE